MTTKERLLEIVEALDEEAAERVLLAAEAELRYDRPLSPEVRESIQRALAQSQAGEYVPQDEVFAEFDLD